MKSDLTAARLRKVLDYCPETGIFRWRVQKTIRLPAGSAAGHLGSRGYWKICIDDREFSAHRLAWLYVHGRWPVEEIDHINGMKADNRIANLREANRKQNCANCGPRTANKTGYRGVVRHGRGYSARIGLNYRKLALGYFKTAEEASTAYRKAAREFHGEFAA